MYSTEVFPAISDFTNFVDTNYKGASPPGGTDGIYSQNYSSVFASYFHLIDDRSLSVAKASFPFVDLSLPPSTTTHEYNFTLDRFARQALLSLPPDYISDANKAYYNAFIQRYGTSVVITASLGGSIEQHTSWKAWLTDVDHEFTKQKLADTSLLPVPSRRLRTQHSFPRPAEAPGHGTRSCTEQKLIDTALVPARSRSS